MSLLLDDDDEYNPPTKVMRTEPVMADSMLHNGVPVERTNVIAEGNSSAAELNIARRGGDGVEKMAAFAFAAGVVKVNLVDRLDHPSPSGATTTTTTATTSQEQTPSTCFRGNNPPTVPKVVKGDVSPSSQHGSSALLSPFSGSPDHPSSTDIMENNNDSTSAVPTVCELFPQGDAIKSGISGVGNTTPTGKSPLRAQGGIPTPPKSQMKLSDFFAKMACVRKM
ncbi:uncharacterized protein TEOVI_000858400 [Trypanosoma equiperdum]|uniref:Uncharacterized protein n=2 Tax=Trypanozoon TaxID=39700 RepID=Q381V2_TRYB2|nr:hypothetical protein, conserved [Trypanosoma brucei brucei TREU927]EAN80429.1 hypothetical protein, conserved [Trypanosoma brucei brucei TREU927]SCU67784.1 hypothetical protein, conserved [Trypanosoma equiperdum]